MVVLLVGACGAGATPTPGAATATPGVAMPTAGEATPTVAGSTAPAESQTAATTSEPTAPPAATACVGDGAGGPLTGEITLWHSYGSGAGPATDALNEALAVVCEESPGLRVDAVGLDFGSLLNLYELQAVDGDPDLFVAPNDSLWERAEATLLQNLTDTLDATKFSQLAMDGSKYTTTAGEAGIWQVPESLNAVALYYNKDSVPTPPATTGELKSAIEGGVRVALEQAIYPNFGWWGAHGGQLMDDDGKCIADRGGVADALAYLAELKAAGATFVTNYADMSSGFNNGDFDMIVDGPWAADVYAENVANLAVAPMPAGPAGPALPMVGVDGYNMNPHGHNVELAIAFAIRMVQPDIQTIYANTAYHIPSRPDVPPSDNEVTAQFATAIANGALRPQRPELRAFRGNFENALTQVLDEGVDPATAVSEACTAMNEANGK